MKKRKHRKTVITNVNPRSQWGALRTQNQRLIFGYLVAKTSVKRKGIQFRLDRQEVLTDKEKCWNGIYVTNEELAEFLILNTGLSKESCRKTIQRTLQYLESVKYIILHHGATLVNQHSTKRAVEVLWDDRNYCFIAPLKPEMSNSAGTSAGTKNGSCRDTAGTKIDSAGTKSTINVPAPNEEYGSTESRIEDFGGAYINNKIINNKVSTKTPQQSGQEIFSHPSSHEAESGDGVPRETPVTRETPATTSAAISSAMSQSNHQFDQSDLHPAFRVRYEPISTRVDKPVELLSFWDTPGVVQYPRLKKQAKEMIEHVKAKYDYDCSFLFEAENYRRLICPEVRADVQIDFGELPDNLTVDDCIFFPETFDLIFTARIYKECPDMFHRMVTILRYAPRGIVYHRDIHAYWYPPLMHVALDYSSYTRSPKTTESKFHRDASLTQLYDIVFANRLPDVVVNGKEFSGMYFNVVLKRQIFWLCGVTASTREALEGLLPKFEKDLLENSKSKIYQDYQKKILSGSFGTTNLIHWFKDYALRYHYHGWWMDRIKNDDGTTMLSSLGANCDTSGSATGVIAYIPTSWGQPREMYFTTAQWKLYDRLKVVRESNVIGQ